MHSSTPIQQPSRGPAPHSFQFLYHNMTYAASRRSLIELCDQGGTGNLGQRNRGVMEYCGNGIRECCQLQHSKNGHGSKTGIGSEPINGKRWKNAPLQGACPPF
jgi:hypothetical protein